MVEKPPEKSVAESDKNKITGNVPAGGDGLRFRVREAAASILAQGNRPTVAAVRGILGRGNANAINEALGEFYRDVGNQLVAGAGRLPETDLPPAFLEGAKTLYKVAADLAREALARDREDAARQVAAAEEKMRAAQEAQQKAEELLVATLKDVRRLEAVAAEREAALSREIARAEESQRHIGHLQREMQSREQTAAARLEALDAKVGSLEQAVARERARADDIQRQRDAEVRAHRSDLDALRTEHRRNADAWEASRQQFQEDFGELQDKLQAAEAGRAAVDGRLAVLGEELQRLRGAHTVLQTERQGLATALAGARATVVAFENTVTERGDRIRELEQTVATLREESERLRVQLARAGEPRNQITDG